MATFVTSDPLVMTIRPDPDVMRQDFQLGHHLLGFEAFLVALAGSQPLLILLDLDFDCPPTLVVQQHVSQQHRSRVADALGVPSNRTSSAAL
jgi:hypothetical protein